MSKDRAMGTNGTVLVAGSGGFLGRAITASLVEEGRRVRGLVRDPHKAELLRELGGEPFVGDVLDRGAVGRAMEGCEAVVHVAATYPGPGVTAELARRVRVEGATNLAEAARAAGAHRLILGSGYWVYADRPGTLVEDSPVDPRGESRVNYEAERAGLDAAAAGHLDVVIVRPGMVYGDGSWFRGMVESIREGAYHYAEPGANHWSLVELGDAARAFAVLLRRGRAGETYVVVDDFPIRLRDLTRLIARELGVPTPTGRARATLERAIDPEVVHHLAANRAASNQKLRGLGWAPRTADARQGIPPLLASMAAAPKRRFMP